MSDPVTNADKLACAKRAIRETEVMQAIIDDYTRIIETFGEKP